MADTKAVDTAKVGETAKAAVTAMVEDTKNAKSKPKQEGKEPPAKKAKRVPRRDWNQYRRADGTYECPRCHFSMRRSFHNASNLSKHCDRKHDGWRPPFKDPGSKRLPRPQQAPRGVPEPRFEQHRPFQNRTFTPLPYAQRMPAAAAPGPAPTASMIGMDAAHMVQPVRN
eukprot:CAMPEP_0118870786 /NCGR_PEP_ID=MMETSP1163-20130328/13616_1 /TAXON_ID=124430 /ORGANISM="Phaeomonas parva, Strain CCMP2877" /LENGTH=169 /DNA_ID=CAMNT_0006805825 /DNA_START=123 /DNA_END=629 /DNA_ORIENTATION=+